MWPPAIGGLEGCLYIPTERRAQRREARIIRDPTDVLINRCVERNVFCRTIPIQATAMVKNGISLHQAVFSQIKPQSPQSYSSKGTIGQLPSRKGPPCSELSAWTRRRACLFEPFPTFTDVFPPMGHALRVLQSWE